MTSRSELKRLAIQREACETESIPASVSAAMPEHEDEETIDDEIDRLGRDASHHATKRLGVIEADIRRAIDRVLAWEPAGEKRDHFVAELEARIDRVHIAMGGRR